MMKDQTLSNNEGLVRFLEWAYINLEGEELSNIKRIESKITQYHSRYRGLPVISIIPPMNWVLSRGENLTLQDSLTKYYDYLLIQNKSEGKTLFELDIPLISEDQLACRHLQYLLNKQLRRV